jgi:hypothetical protein
VHKQKVKVEFSDEFYTPCKQLLRKEVIQPQLPLRLPCYDLAPVTGFTLGILLPERLEK